MVMVVLFLSSRTHYYHDRGNGLGFCNSKKTCCSFFLSHLFMGRIYSPNAYGDSPKYASICDDYFSAIFPHGKIARRTQKNLLSRMFHTVSFSCDQYDTFCSGEMGRINIFFFIAETDILHDI